MRNWAAAVLTLWVLAGCGTPVAECNATSCPTGCCNASGSCQPATAATCGSAGNMCMACGSGQVCQAGACVRVTVDAGMDAGMDAGQDAGRDAGMDAGVDAGMDAGVDAGMDAGMEDAGMDGGDDAGTEDAGPQPLGTVTPIAGGPLATLYGVFNQDIAVAVVSSYPFPTEDDGGEPDAGAPDGSCARVALDYLLGTLEVVPDSGVTVLGAIRTTDFSRGPTVGQVTDPDAGRPRPVSSLAVGAESIAAAWYPSGTGSGASFGNLVRWASDGGGRREVGIFPTGSTQILGAFLADGGYLLQSYGPSSDFDGRGYGIFRAVDAVDGGPGLDLIKVVALFDGGASAPTLATRGPFGVTDNGVIVVTVSTPGGFGGVTSIRAIPEPGFGLAQLTTAATTVLTDNTAMDAGLGLIIAGGTIIGNDLIVGLRSTQGFGPGSQPLHWRRIDRIPLAPLPDGGVSVGPAEPLVVNRDVCNGTPSNATMGRGPGRTFFIGRGVRNNARTYITQFQLP